MEEMETDNHHLIISNDDSSFTQDSSSYTPNGEQYVTTAASLEDITTEVNISMCNKHTNYKADRFCTVCKMSVCCRCVQKEHASCAYIPLYKGIAHQKTFLEASLVEANTHLEYIRKRFMDISLLLSTESQQTINILQAVDEEFNKLTIAIEKRRQAVHEDVKETFRKRHERIELLQKTLQCKNENLCQGKKSIENILLCCDDREILESQQSYDKFMRTYFLDNNDFHPSSEDLLQFIPYRRDQVYKEIANFGHITHSAIKPKNSTFSVGFHQICAVHEDVAVPLVLRDSDNREIHLDSETIVNPKEFTVSIISPHENAYHAHLEIGERDYNNELETSKKLFLNYAFDLPGTYDVSVKVLGEHIKGSPFTIKVVEKENLPDGGVGVGGSGGGDSHLRPNNKRSTRFIKPKISSVSPRRKMITTRSLSNLRHNSTSLADQKSVGRRSAGVSGIGGTSTSRGATPTALSSAQSGAFLIDDLKFKIGGQGRNKGQFSNPQGAFFSKLNRRICICDSNNACIQVFKENGTFCFRFGQRGRESGQLQRPIDIAETQQGNLVISDYDNHCINIYSKEGRYLTRFGQKTLVAPKGVAVDHENRIVAVDNKNCCICVFKSTGKFLFKFGSRGSADHQLAGVHYIAVNSLNHYLVTDFHNHAVKVYDAKGTFLFIFGKHGLENGCFHSPTGIAVDSKDNIIVTDWGNARVQVFDSVGNFLNVVNSNADPLYGPQGVTVLSDSSILVIDSGNHCFKVYEFPLT